jgi:hypothetical protein
MNINPITNKLELNLQETHILRRLDESVALGEPKVVETQFGEITVRKNVAGQFTASICTAQLLDVVFDRSTSGAFLKLAGKIRNN